MTSRRNEHEERMDQAAIRGEVSGRSSDDIIRSGTVATLSQYSVAYSRMWPDGSTGGDEAAKPDRQVTHHYLVCPGCNKEVGQLEFSWSEGDTLTCVCGCCMVFTGERLYYLWRTVPSMGVEDYALPNDMGEAHAGTAKTTIEKEALPDRSSPTIARIGRVV